MKSRLARTVSTSGRFCELPRFAGSSARITGGNQRKSPSSEWARKTLKTGEKRLERPKRPHFVSVFILPTGA
jgi:hypothetical protein